MTKNFLVFTCIIIGLYSCHINTNSNEEDKGWEKYAEQTVKYWENREMLLPKNLPIVSNNLTDTSFDKTFVNPIRMVIYVDGTCGVCIGNLKHWKKFIDDVRNQNAKCDFIFYIQAEDKNDFQHDVMSKLDLATPWIFDSSTQFIKSNNLYDQRFQAALLDKNNKVKIIGNIMFRPELEKLYKETILKLGK